MKTPSRQNSDSYIILMILVLSLSFGAGGCQRRAVTENRAYNTQTYDLDRKMAPLENAETNSAPADNSMGNITIKF